LRVHNLTGAYKISYLKLEYFIEGLNTYMLFFIF